MANTKKYSVEILESEGSTKSDLFKKMAERGDITSIKVEDMVGANISINGYAKCHIETDDKNFDIVYYSTDAGYISSGSEVLLESVKTYMEDAERFVIVKVKTSKGFTYKVSPLLEDKKEVA